jgi:hypothetical protein
MSRRFSRVVLGLAVWLLAASAVLAEEKPRDKQPQPPVAKGHAPPLQAGAPKPRLIYKPKPSAPPARAGSLPADRRSAGQPQPTAVDVPRTGEREAAIERALASPTQVEFVETPLQDVIDYLKDLHRIEIQIDTKALSDVGIDPSTPITKNLKGISLRSALRLMLRELCLTYVIQDEVLLITTPEEADCHLTTKLYPVADLVVCRNSKGELWDDYDTLIDIITGTNQPTTWDDAGGAGWIGGASLGTAKVLIVSQSQVVHEQIIALLEQIRAVAAKTPNAGTPQRDKKQPELPNRGFCR